MKRLFIGAVGGLVLMLGVAMILLPGPAVAVIPMGLTILGKEFAWPKRWLENMKACTMKLKNRLHCRRTHSP
jgi:tellurite resistance protein TerC